MIRIYIGLLGSGKTLSMVKDMYNDNKNGRKIVSNLILKFTKNQISQDFFEKFASGKKEELFNVTLGLDELHIFLDSRRSTSKRNTYLSYFILQTRKRDVVLRGTSQFFNQIDLRLRNITDYLTQCEALIKQGNKFIKVTPVKAISGLTEEETENLWIKNTTIDRSGKVINKSIFKAKPYFNLYDTNQIIDFQ